MRIARMQAVLRGGRGGSWARTAAEHGYYDEAHMANEIRELGGQRLTPCSDDRFFQVVAALAF